MAIHPRDSIKRNKSRRCSHSRIPWITTQITRAHFHHVEAISWKPRLSYLFAQHLLSSDSFSSTLLSSNLSLLSASALLCFWSVHIVGSLTSKLPSTTLLVLQHSLRVTPCPLHCSSSFSLQSSLSFSLVPLAILVTLPSRDNLPFALQLFSVVTTFPLVTTLLVLQHSLHLTPCPVHCSSSFSLQSSLSFSLVPLAILVTLPSRDNLSFALQLFSVVTTFPLVTTLLVLQHSLRLTPCPLHCSSSFSLQSSLSFSLVPLAILVTLPSRDNLPFPLQLFSVVTTFPLVTTLLVLQHSLRVTPCPLHCSSSFSLQSSLSFSLVLLAILVTLPSRDNLSFALQLFSVVTTFPLVTTLLVLQHSLRLTPCPLHCSSSFSLQSSLKFSLVPLAILISNAPFTWQLVVCVAALLCRYNLSSRYNSACVTILVYVATRLRYDFLVYVATRLLCSSVPFSLQLLIFVTRLCWLLNRPLSSSMGSCQLVDFLFCYNMFRPCFVVRNAFCDWLAQSAAMAGWLAESAAMAGWLNPPPPWLAGWPADQLRRWLPGWLNPSLWLAMAGWLADSAVMAGHWLAGWLIPPLWLADWLIPPLWLAGWLNPLLWLTGWLAESAAMAHWLAGWIRRCGWLAGWLKSKYQTVMLHQCNGQPDFIRISKIRKKSHLRGKRCCSRTPVVELHARFLSQSNHRHFESVSGLLENKWCL